MTIFRAAITAVVGLFGQAVGSDRPAAEDGSTASPAAPDAAVAQAADADAIPLAWLADKVSVAQAEADNPGVVDERITRFPELGKPFGGLNRKWEALKAQMRSGDELWTFSSPADSWKNLAGRAGIALVRDGTVIATLVTILN